MGNEGSTLLQKKLEHMLALANSVCLMALSPGMSEREITATHSTARHSTVTHGRARHRTAQRYAATLNEVGVLFCCFLSIYVHTLVTDSFVRCDI